MRVQYPSRLSASPFDRYDERIIRLFVDVALSPHSLTERLSYTVPAGRILWVDTLWLYMWRNETATVPDRMEILITIYPGGGAARQIARIHKVTNLLYDGVVLQFPTPFTLRENDVISIYTADYSTGGTCGAHLSLMGYTFHMV